MSRLAGRDIAIIGAGIGGLTAALAFAQQGALVTVYEQAPSLTEVGAGLQISPNGARVLDALGLSSICAEFGITAKAVVPTNGLTGKPVTRFDLSTQTPPYRFFHRFALVEMLYKAALNVGVSFLFNAKVGADELPNASLIVGADGLHSVIRPLVNSKTRPFFTGQVAWRGIVPNTDAAAEAKIWMGPGKHVVTYPLTGGDLNVVAVQERLNWAEEGWHQADDPANLRAAFADCAPDLQAILGKIAQPNLWGLFRHPVAQAWFLNEKVLLGDAAHPTLPFMAQGANLAIEDAFVLVAALSVNGDDGTGLAAYQKARRSRVVRAVEAANKNARNYHLSGISARAAHLGLAAMGKVAPNAFINRLSWLYDHDVTTQDYQLAAV